MVSIHFHCCLANPIANSWQKSCRYQSLLSDLWFLTTVSHTPLTVFMYPDQLQMTTGPGEFIFQVYRKEQEARVQHKSGFISWRQNSEVSLWLDLLWFGLAIFHSFSAFSLPLVFSSCLPALLLTPSFCLSQRLIWSYLSFASLGWHCSPLNIFEAYFTRNSNKVPGVEWEHY